MSARPVASLFNPPIAWRGLARRPATVAGLAVTCGLLGYGVAHDWLITAALAGVALAAIAMLLAGTERSATVAVALLPWLVLLINLTPKLTLTLTAAAAVLLLLVLTPPNASIGLLPWIGVAAFYIVIVVHAAQSGSSSQLQEAAKFALFPAMALVVANPAGRRRLVSMRTTLLASGVAAMAVQAASILLHFGQSNTYYGTGEQLGLTAESPHELALIGVMLSIACLLSVRRLHWRIIGAAITATPALATGVRSALVALAMVLVLLAIQNRFRPSTILGIAAILAAIIFSGVGTIIVNRYAADQASGEYSSFLTAGSGRGAVWTTALDQWARASPVRMTVGYGFRAIESIEQRNLGQFDTAQSDPVAIIVELGLLGLAAWLLVWLVILRSGARWLVLVPLAIYMIVSGSMEYVGAVVFGIALAGALTSPRHLHGAGA